MNELYFEQGSILNLEMVHTTASRSRYAFLTSIIPTDYKMEHNMASFLIFIAFFLRSTINATEDLLDQYVKHVENVNKIAYSDSESNQRYSNYAHPKGRHLSRKLKAAKEDTEEDTDEGNDIFSIDSLDIFSDTSEYRERRDVSSDDILWTHSEVLDHEERVILRWQPRHQEILFRVEARTRGYVGLGFSPDGKMEKADIILGWVDDRTNKAILMVSLLYFI
ncbi:hypothetical protein JTB14_030645 [Gonioctena quinquepunctata]|nr:hypothetical protein JTB14_030645 [Gonioctena quinquepunctata]